MNTRKDNRGQALRKWISMAPGLIQKPLRHIGNRTNGVDHEGRTVLSAEFINSRRAANFGDGVYVQQMARLLL